MINIYDRSIVELVDLEEELHIARQDEVPGALGDLIEVQEILFEKLRNHPDDEHADSIEVFRRKLVTNLIRYGAYLKVENQKDYQAEEVALKLAVAYEPNNEAAYYRLGVLAFETKCYAEAVNYFQKALDYTHDSEGYRFKLAPQQAYNATLYMKLSALYAAKSAQTSLHHIMGDLKRSDIEEMDTSNLNDWIEKSEAYLEKHAYVFISTAGKKYHSSRDYEAIIKEEANTLVLDFAGRNIELRFNGEKTDILLSAVEAELLEEMMLYSSATRTLRGGQLQEPLFSNTLRQRITRLRSVIARLGLTVPAIKNKTVRIGAGRVTTYYYNQELPFLIIHQDSELY